MTDKIPTNRKEGLIEAYYWGFERTSWGWNSIKKEVRQELDEYGEKAARTKLDNLQCDYHALLHEGQEYNRFIWALRDRWDRLGELEAFESELVVAEDYITAYEAGAYDSILGKEANPERISHLYD